MSSKSHAGGGDIVKVVDRRTAPGMERRSVPPEHEGGDVLERTSVRKQPHGLFRFSDNHAVQRAAVLQRFVGAHRWVPAPGEDRRRGRRSPCGGSHRTKGRPHVQAETEENEGRHKGAQEGFQSRGDPLHRVRGAFRKRAVLEKLHGMASVSEGGSHGRLVQDHPARRPEKEGTRRQVNEGDVHLQPCDVIPARVGDADAKGGGVSDLLVFPRVTQEPVPCPVGG